MGAYTFTVAILLSFVLTSLCSNTQLQWLLLAGLSVILLLQQTWKIVMRVRTFWTLVLSVFKYSNVIVKLASRLMSVYYCDVVVPQVLFAVSIGILPARFACVQKKQCTGNGSLSSANCQNQADKGKGLRVLHHQTDGNLGMKRLHRACLHGDIETVHDLISHYSARLKVYIVLDNPIHAAVKGGSVEVLSTILQHVDISIQLPKYVYLLHVAVIYRHHKVLGMLLDFVPGLLACINQPIRNTLLVIAAVKEQSLPCLRILRLRGANMMQKDCQGHCALNYAIEQKSCRIIGYILNTSSCNDRGQCTQIMNKFFSNAMENFRWDILETLLMQKAFTQGMHHWLSFVYKHKKLAHLDSVLMHNGLNVNIYNDKLETPFDVYLLECVFSLRECISLSSIKQKLHLHISVGLDCNRFTVNDKNLTCIGMLLNLHGGTHTTLLGDLLHLLYESGYKFTQDFDIISFDNDVFNSYLKLTSRPLTLARMCSNIVRCSLQPNALVGIKKLNLPMSLEGLILMDDFKL